MFSQLLSNTKSIVKILFVFYAVSAPNSLVLSNTSSTTKKCNYLAILNEYGLLPFENDVQHLSVSYQFLKSLNTINEETSGRFHPELIIALLNKILIMNLTARSGDIPGLLTVSTPHRSTYVSRMSLQIDLSQFNSEIPNLSDILKKTLANFKELVNTPAAERLNYIQKLDIEHIIDGNPDTLISPELVQSQQMQESLEALHQWFLPESRDIDSMIGNIGIASSHSYELSILMSRASQTLRQSGTTKAHILDSVDFPAYIARVKAAEDIRGSMELGGLRGMSSRDRLQVFKFAKKFKVIETIEGLSVEYQALLNKINSENPLIETHKTLTRLIKLLRSLTYISDDSSMDTYQSRSEFSSHLKNASHVLHVDFKGLSTIGMESVFKSMSTFVKQIKDFEDEVQKEHIDSIALKKEFDDFMRLQSELLNSAKEYLETSVSKLSDTLLSIPNITPDQIQFWRIGDDGFFSIQAPSVSSDSIGYALLNNPEVSDAFRAAIAEVKPEHPSSLQDARAWFGPSLSDLKAQEELSSVEGQFAIVNPEEGTYVLRSR